jgi:hypothetical protein
MAAGAGAGAEGAALEDCPQPFNRRTDIATNTTIAMRLHPRTCPLRPEPARERISPRIFDTPLPTACEDSDGAIKFP